jgi:hypothetical protein
MHKLTDSEYDSAYEYHQWSEFLCAALTGLNASADTDDLTDREIVKAAARQADWCMEELHARLKPDEPGTEDFGG